MRHLSLFSGIGGFDLAAEWCGWENVMQVEVDPFCQKVLAKHFPNVPKHRDIKTFNRGILKNGSVDVISGGFPCQPFSIAGKRKGKHDDRYLWPEMLRVISEFQPTWVVGENVAHFVNLELEQAYLDLEAQGYEVQAFIIPACAVNAPHRRDRVWIIAHTHHQHTGTSQSCDRTGPKGRTSLQAQRQTWTRTTIFNHGSSDVLRDAPLPHGQRWEKRDTTAQPDSPEQSSRCIIKDRNYWEETEPPVCGVDDGIPHRSHRLKALGNAIVPQVAYEIFRAIDECSRII